MDFLIVKQLVVVVGIQKKILIRILRSILTQTKTDPNPQIWNTQGEISDDETEEFMLKHLKCAIKVIIDLKDLKGKFNIDYVKTLSYEDRLEYVRNKDNLPDELVYQMQDEVLEFLTY